MKSDELLHTIDIIGKVYEQPKKVLEGTPSINLVEMEGTKEYMKCCGHYPVDSQTTSFDGMDRLKDAEAIGATTIVTAGKLFALLFRNARGGGEYVRINENV